MTFLRHRPNGNCSFFSALSTQDFNDSRPKLESFHPLPNLDLKRPTCVRTDFSQLCSFPAPFPAFPDVAHRPDYRLSIRSIPPPVQYSAPTACVRHFRLESDDAPARLEMRFRLARHLD